MRTERYACVICHSAVFKDSLQQQIHLNDNIFENKCYRCYEGPLYKWYISFLGTTTMELAQRSQSVQYSQQWYWSVKKSKRLWLKIPERAAGYIKCK